MQSINRKLSCEAASFSLLIQQIIVGVIQICFILDCANVVSCIY